MRPVGGRLRTKWAVVADVCQRNSLRKGMFLRFYADIE